MSGIAHTTIIPGITRQGLMAYWDFTRGNSQDLSGNGVHGTDVNIIYNNGANFDGATSYITFPVTLLKFSTASLFVLLDTTDTGAFNGVIYTNWFNIFINNGFIQVYDFVSVSPVFNSTPTNYNNGTPYCIQVNLAHGVTLGSSVYVNGAQVKTNFTWQAGTYIGGLEIPRISQKLAGRIQTAGIYNRILSNDEITRNYQILGARHQLT